LRPLRGGPLGQREWSARHACTMESVQGRKLVYFHPVSSPERPFATGHAETGRCASLLGVCVKGVERVLTAHQRRRYLARPRRLKVRGRSSTLHGCAPRRWLPRLPVGSCLGAQKHCPEPASTRILRIGTTKMLHTRNAPTLAALRGHHGCSEASGGVYSAAMGRGGAVCGKRSEMSLWAGWSTEARPHGATRDDHQHTHSVRGLHFTHTTQYDVLRVCCA
jgi:hypothetical protein